MRTQYPADDDTIVGLLTERPCRPLYGQHPQLREEGRVEDILIPLAGIIGTFGSIAYIGFLIVDGLKYRHRALQAREFQQKLLDRVTTAQDLGIVLSSQGTAKLLTSLADHASGPRERILRAVQPGVVFVTVGLGLFAYQWFNPSLSGDAQSANALIATVALALGVGLIGAAAAAYIVSRRMGMLDDNTMVSSSL